MWFDKLKSMKNIRGLTTQEVAERSKVPEPTLEKLFAGKTKDPKLSTIIAVVHALGYTLDDLDDKGTPRGNAQQVTPEAIKIAEDFDALDTWGKEHIRATVRIEISRKKDELVRRASDSIRPSTTAQLIPFRLSTQPASAGTGAYLGPEAFETVFVEPTELTRKASFGVRVSGDSMEPRYHDGDVLIVERADDIAVGDIGIFTVRGDGYVKQRGRGELISLNPDYDSIPMTEDTRCNGRVIGTIDPSRIVEA